jgi:hypothetical protein
MHLKHSRIGTAVLAAAVALAVSSVAAQEAPKTKDAQTTKKEVFTANAVNNSNIGSAGIVRVEIGIDRWSTAGETEHLLSIFNEQGPKALLTELQKTQRVGYIRTPGSLSYDLRYARELPQPGGGRRIVLGTDRPMGFFEASEQPRSAEYPFTVIDLQLNAMNRGSGTLSYATKLSSVGGILVVENFADQPIRLTDVKKEK